ncbi:NrsF family protein [Mesorhizobium sp. VNQ89]|uniref:NrsF family protein n=1 Tax=Mesorhizobium quangtriensis TaxID=3157709 RepID=UPI0032B7E904
MDTEQLIRTLSADAARPALPMARAWSLAAGAAFVVAAAVFFIAIGPRPDIAAAAETPRFLFKFVVTLTLLGTAFLALKSLARPGASVPSVLPMLLLAPALLLVAAGLEMMVVPVDELRQRWIGSNAMLCMTFIPLIGIGPLAAFLVALRHGAATRPELAGAVAGLVSGGLAATFYAAHCFDDSPLFVATWYPLAIAILVIAGALAGRTFARW